MTRLTRKHKYMKLSRLVFEHYNIDADICAIL